VVDYDEEERWIVMRRGRIAIACNLGEQQVTVPVSGKVLLHWGDPAVGPVGAALPGHSVLVALTAGDA
jgi:maltooligosyltrehalose trehalohydrolase